MKYVVVDNPKELRALRRRLTDRLDASSVYSEERIITSPGGSFRRRIHFEQLMGSHVLWWSAWVNREKGKALYLFGHAQPKTKHALNIEMQFNFPLREFSLKSGGTFLRDRDTGQIVLAHRGIVTHHRARIPKEILFAAVDATIRPAQYRNRVDSLMLISELESSSLVDDLNTFITELRAAIRGLNAARERPSQRRKREPTDDLREYFEEFSGELARTSGTTTIADCHHGDIIRALRAEFKDHVIRKSVGIDLLAYRGRKALLFEAKTSSDPQSVFTAVGQLTIHTIGAKASVKDLMLTKVLVVPQIPSARLASALKKLHIELLTYRRLDSGRIVLADCKRIRS